MRGGAAILLGLAAALIAGLAMPGAATAQAGIVGTPLAVCVARAEPALTLRALLQSPDRFRCSGETASLGSGDFDILSAPLPPGTALHHEARLRVASLWQQRATLAILYADGAILTITTGSHAASHHVQLGAIIEQPLPARDAAAIRVLWRIQGAANVRGIVLGASVATPAESDRSNLAMAAIYAAFAGLCIALIIYNFALWGALRHRFQLAYCAMVTTLLVYAVSSSGALAWMVPTLDNNDRMRINYLALAVAAVSALSFARSFFEARVFDGWLHRLSNVISGLLLTSALAFAILAPWHIRLLDRLYAGSFALLMVAVVPVLWRAWRTRSNYLWLFAVGWAAPIAMASIRVAATFDLIHWSFLLDNSTVIAMTIEAVFSSLAIAYRILLLSRERDEAREQEIAARMLAATDPLTGLLNRRAFLEQAIGRAEPQQLLLADIDHFKRVNETIGHDGGDEVLRVFARALRAAVPPDALVARLGGEEFAIIAPVGSDLSATTVLDGLRSERMPFDLNVTASIGTCTGPLTRDVDWKMLYRGADRALFEAKAAGRDRAREAVALAVAA